MENKQRKMRNEGMTLPCGCPGSQSRNIQRQEAPTVETPQAQQTSCLSPVSYTHLDVYKRQGFSFFVAPLGALMALLFPEPLFSGFSLLMPRIFGYYVTHAILVVCGLSLATLGFYRPDPKDIPQDVYKRQG